MEPESTTVASLPATMRAWTHTSMGPPSKVLSLATVPLPTFLTPTSVLVRISHASLHPGASIMMQLVPMFFRRQPAIPETDFSGTIVSTGSDVPSTPLWANQNRYFAAGDPVFGSVPTGSHARRGVGALAEYVAVEMDRVARRPENISPEAAAGIGVSATTALDLLDMAGLKEGMRVLINAPCGGIGVFATQMARRAVGGRGRIVGVCSEGKSGIARRLGCDETVDYRPTSEGKRFVEVLAERFGGEERFDVVLDCNGSQELWHSCPEFLKAGPGCSYTTVGSKFTAYTYRAMLAAVWNMFFNAVVPSWAGGVARSYKQVASVVSAEKLERLRSMIEEGYLGIEIGGRWSMEEVLKAYEVLLGGHATGKLIVQFGQSS